MTDSLLAWRDHFPILQETTYLVNHSLGAMPRGVYDSLRAYADGWATRGVRMWGDAWWELNGVVGDKIARIIGAPSGSVSMHENASITLSILMSAFPFDAQRPKVVIDSMIFPTDYYVLTQMLPPHVELHMVQSRDGMTVPLDELLDAIDERTGLVVVNHVLFRSGAIMPLAPIIEQAHRVGAKVLVDSYHGVGIVPLDVTALNIDYLVGGVLKWMCGGPGGVFLYVRPDLREALRPKITGWFAHKRPFDFEVSTIEFRDDAYRFLNGTYGVASLYAIQPGIDIITQVGVEAIRAKSRRLTALLIEEAQAAGFTIRTPLDPDTRGGMVVVIPPHEYPVSQALIARNIMIDYRPNAGIRVAPHFYNTEDEVRMVIRAMREILESGEWQPYAEGREFVT
jgi:kynureninase